MFKLEFYDAGTCDRCGGGDAAVHMEVATRYAAECARLAFCWACWNFIRAKADRALTTPKKAQ